MISTSGRDTRWKGVSLARYFVARGLNVINSHFSIPLPQRLIIIQILSCVSNSFPVHSHSRVSVQLAQTQMHIGFELNFQYSLIWIIVPSECMPLL